MCGIVGLYVPKGLENNLESVIKANEAAHHRGPDGFGFAFFNTLTSDKSYTVTYDVTPLSIQPPDATLVFGHRRLAIIDLSTAGL